MSCNTKLNTYPDEIIPSINRSFVYKAKEGRHVRMQCKSFVALLELKSVVEGYIYNTSIYIFTT